MLGKPTKDAVSSDHKGLTQSRLGPDVEKNRALRILRGNHWMMAVAEIRGNSVFGRHPTNVNCDQHMHMRAADRDRHGIAQIAYLRKSVLP